ncbi:MAG: hypothetical protein R2770_09575 [Acidimicrobiales bacterium]
MNEVFEVRPAQPQEAAGSAPRGDDEPAAIADPVGYIVQMAKAHQVVFVGDRRGVAQHLETIRSAIAPLHEAGVSSLTWEFTHSRRQAELDRVTQSAEWDRRTAVALFVDLMGIGHGYEEYLDVIHAVWQRNIDRPEGWPPFRLVAAGLPTFVEDPDLLDGRSAAETELRNWWMGGHYRDISAIHMANVITNEVIRHGERTVVYADEARTHTNYVGFDGGAPDVTPAMLLKKWVGPGVARIVFHGATPDDTLLDDVEQLVAASSESLDSFGIDLRRSTIGNVRVRALGGVVDATPGPFELADLADGYLFVAPRRDWRPVELIPDLLGPATLAAAERRHRSLDPRPEPYTHDELEQLRSEGRDALVSGWPAEPSNDDQDDPRRPSRRFGRRR